jgi:hypothetical protein
MQHRQSNDLETLRHVEVFLDADTTAVEPTFSSSRCGLDDVIADLATYAAAQQGGNISSRGETAKQHALRSTLRNEDIDPTAEVTRQTHGDVSYGMPATNATSAHLVAHAVVAAKVHERGFKDTGLPDDVLADPQSVAGEVSQPIDDRKHHAGNRSGASVRRERKARAQQIQADQRAGGAGVADRTTCRWWRRADRPFTSERRWGTLDGHDRARIRAENTKPSPAL